MSVYNIAVETFFTDGNCIAGYLSGAPDHAYAL